MSSSSSSSSPHPHPPPPPPAAASSSYGSISAIVRNAGTASLVSDHSISFTIFIIIMPTSTSDGPAAHGGTFVNNGMKNSDTKKQRPTVMAANPEAAARFIFGNCAVSTIRVPISEGGEGGGGFMVSDLVWGKVRSHPWWPGQVFDPANASELALKPFGDKTFAWNDASLLRPFGEDFTRMARHLVRISPSVSAIEYIDPVVSRTST